MALFRIEDRYPDYEDRFADGDGIMGSNVYVRTPNGDDAIGKIDTVLVNEAGDIRYLVLKTGFWVFGKRVLLPIERCIDDPEQNRIYAAGLEQGRIDHLPKYDGDTDDYSETYVRPAYRISSASHSVPVELSPPVEQNRVKGYRLAPVAGGATVSPLSQNGTATSVDRTPPHTHSARQTNLDGLDGQDNHQFRLHEERLVVDRHRIKTGEVTVSKRVETEPSATSVPIRKEKIVIEIESIAGATQVNTPGGHLRDGETTHIDLYEEQVSVRKEPVVRQEVTIRKEVQQDEVVAHESLRREELDVKRQQVPNGADRS